jgi:hypothetical protein
MHSPRRTLRSVARRLPTDGRQARILSPFVGVRATKRRSVSKRPSGAQRVAAVSFASRTRNSRTQRDAHAKPREARSRSSRSCNRLPKLGVHGVDIGHGDLAAAGTTAAPTTGRFVRLADIGPSIERAAGDEQAQSPEPVPSTLQNRLYWPGQFPQLWSHAHLRPAHP